jgi:CO/xanthine dehydrogenase Mo-binding subunit
LVLVQAAANQWGVPVAECTVEKSVITHGPSKRKTTYGKVAEAAAKLEPPKDIKLKDPKDWKIIGKPINRLDTLDKVTGKQVYGFDLKMPGMLNAAIKECPVFGGKVKSFDAARVSGMSGVRHVLPVGATAVAVVADTWWQAKSALDKLPIEWDEGANAKVSSASIAEILKAGLDAEQAFVGNQAGDVKAALGSAAKKVEAVYSYPFQNHVCMEPMNATARYTPDRCEVWVPTQDGEGSFAALLSASGLPAEKCEVHKLHLGGGFGRRGAFQDYVTQAVLIAKQVPRNPGEAAVVARGGHGAGPLPPDHAVQARGGVRRQEEPHRPAHAPVGAVDPGRGAARDRRAAERPRPARLPGRGGHGRALARLHLPEHADRPRDAQHARAAGLLARREHQPERDLPRVLHGRAGRGRG